MTMRPTIIDIMRKLAAFADVGDNRTARSDEETIADWQSLKGSTVLKARITLGDARAAREFLDRMNKARQKSIEAKDIQHPAFGDF